VRVFILNTGRCGSTTIIRACEHLTNYTAGHETRARAIGDGRLRYPDRHVEADNRLSWFLGDLGERFGDEPLYVHLRRDPELVAASYLRRWRSPYVSSMVRAFAHGLVIHNKQWPEADRLDVCRFYVRTVTKNIEAFLADKTNTMTVWLEDATTWFPTLWDRIGGEGDLDAAMSEFGVRHNASRSPLSGGA
jgi:hypothetical protein